MELDNISKSIEQDELIERFIRNQMSQEEEKAFLEEVKNDAELKERAFVTALMAKGMKKKRQEEEQAFISQLDEAITANAHRAKNVAIKHIISVAAALLIYMGFGGYLRFTENNYQERNKFVSANISFSEISSDRGEGSITFQGHLDSISSAIKKSRDMTQIILELQDMYDKQKTDIECAQNSSTITWYLAMAYIKDDQKEEAANLLLTLKKEQPEMEKQIDKVLKQLQ